MIWLSRERLDHKQKIEEKYLSNYSALLGLKFDTHGSSTVVISDELQVSNFRACRTTVREPVYNM